MTSAFQPETDTERAARLEAQRQADARQYLRENEHKLAPWGKQ